MKKLFIFLSLTIFIVFTGCQENNLTCEIISPYDGQSILWSKDLIVTIKVKNNNDEIPDFRVFLNDIEFSQLAPQNTPYSFTIPCQILTLGKLSIKVVASINDAVQAEASITVNVVEGLDPKEESPDFVTFSDGKLPPGWITYSWEIEDMIGYSDKYSLRAANYPIAIVFANKTITATSYLEYYTKGGDIDLYIDDEKAKSILCEPVERDWTKWIYSVDTGKHVFQWQAEGVYKYLDDIRFYTE